jgi:hypothetical protein
MPKMNMVIQNFSGNWKNGNGTGNNFNLNYNSSNNVVRTAAGYKIAMGGPILGRIQFAKPGCSSCGK